MKKLMILGGSRYVIPVIETAHKLGIYVITCDYLPDNPAHKVSDEYVNVSVIDREATLAVARELKIDGIISFGCDPGVVTAAYVAEKMGLPFQGSCASVEILQDKGLFRQFLAENGFHTPFAKRYSDANAPFADVDLFSWPVIVKPVDSAGSKGVTKVDTPEELGKAIEKAMQCSIGGAFIVEEFLTFEGYHSTADIFVVGKELGFLTYMDHLFDAAAENPFTPTFNILPSMMKPEHQEYLARETQRMITLLNLKTGIYNIETCVANGGIPYIMELSPRGGGGGLAVIQDLAYGTELIENEIRNAVNLPLKEIPKSVCDGVWCSMVIHGEEGRSGILKEIIIAPEIQEKYVRFSDISAKKGDMVKPFTGANMALGELYLRFDSRAELEEVVSRQAQWLQIVLDEE